MHPVLCRKLCPLETQCWPPGTPALGVRSARSSGHPTGQPSPMHTAALSAWPWAMEITGLGGRVKAHNPLLPVNCLCPQPTRGHGSGWRGDLYQRLGQPPRAAQSPRQSGPGDHGHHQGRHGAARWPLLLGSMTQRGAVSSGHSQDGFGFSKARFGSWLCRVGFVFHEPPTFSSRIRLLGGGNGHWA